MHKAAARADASADFTLVVGPRARPRQRTGQCNIPRTPSSSVEVPPPTHPNLLPGGGTRAAASEALALVKEHH